MNKKKKQAFMCHRPAVKIDTKWCYTVHAAAENYASFSCRMWRENLKKTPTPDFTTAYWVHWDRAYALSRKVFSKHLPR